MKSEEIFSNKFITLVHDYRDDGLDYSYIRPKGMGVRIIALNSCGELLLVRQHRHPISAEIWEIPAGGVEFGESLLEAGRRELKEETGFASDQWRVVSEVFPLPNLVDFRAAFVLAVDVFGLKIDMPNRPEYHETIDQKFCSLESVETMIARGEIADEKTIASITLLRLSENL